MSETPNRVCIIGAGSSGIAACKVLKEHDIPFDCYEASDRVGGNWAYENPNGMSSAYLSLFINTSKPRMQYSDYPMPPHYPVFPHHTQIFEYFNNYVDRFHVRNAIRFNTSVTNAEPLPDGGWQITLSDGSTQRYRGLLVANGHHWDPRWPEPPFPGHFDGEVMHSHYYKTADAFAGKHVLVVGFGNSAMDIASETSRVSALTYLAVRRGFYIIPKYLFGKPLDQNAIVNKLPGALRRGFTSLLLRTYVGDLREYGLPRPDQPALHAHPTISSEILNRITHGRVIPKPNIRQLDGDGVIFVDGTREQIDCIIYCTGYKVTFPFFKPEVLEAKYNELPLFHRVFSPRYSDLFFLGLLQPLGAVMPLAELQSIWISKYLLGQYTLPAPNEMQRAIQHERAAVRRRYGNSPRHTMQVDFEDYVRGVQREMRRGAHEPPVASLIERAPQQQEAVQK